MTSANEVTAAAARWLIALEGETSPQLWEEFQAWLAADRRHEAAFVRLRQAWQRCDAFKMLRTTDGAVDLDLLGETFTVPSGDAGAGRRAPFLSRRHWLVAAGAAAAGLAGIALVKRLDIRHERWLEYETEVGGSRNTVLADRSRLELNTDTKVRVRLASGRRDIELMRGETLFTVAHNDSRPFYVKAAETLVCAVGTQFSVRLHEDRSVDVLVAEGQVAIGNPPPAADSDPTLPESAPRVDADHSVTVRHGYLTVQVLPPQYVTRKLAWTAGRISFAGETLAEAVREFNRYNRLHLEIADPTIAALQIGASFRATDPESFVATLEKHFDVRRLPPERGHPDLIRLASKTSQL